MEWNVIREVLEKFSRIPLHFIRATKTGSSSDKVS